MLILLRTSLTSWSIYFQIMVTIYENKSPQSDREKRWKEQEDALTTEETVAESGRIFIRYKITNTIPSNIITI